MLTNPQFDRFRRLASSLAGIHLAERHRDLLDQRRRRLGIGEGADLEALLAAAEVGEKAARATLLGLLTTKFTCFFRHPGHFALAANEALRAVQATGRARLWSAGAATGQEPYSLAIAVIEAFGRDDPPVSILATDVDGQSLSVAERGEYGEVAMEGLDTARRERFFRRAEAAGRWRVVDGLRRLVEFRPLNLAGEEWPAEGSFDVIFCRNAELYEWWERGEYRPYEREELINLIVACKAMVPRYCRLNRIIRDIPAGHIVAGNKESHLRQVVQREMQRRGLRCQCIRCREVGMRAVKPAELSTAEMRYDTDVSEEWFLSADTPEDRLAGFLRLSLPRDRSASATLFAELQGCAMIREVHVYGPALRIGGTSEGEAQHVGLGRRLVERAADIARGRGYDRLAVIAAVGTRSYYRRLGFLQSGLYMTRLLTERTYATLQNT